jgi:hypothetical protein
MRGRVRVAVYTAVLGLGVATAAAVGAGADDVRACADKRTGEIRSTSAKGTCRAGSFVITISGEAFKRASNKSGTLTINGVAFKRSGGTLTINGTAFKGSARGQTLTINGTAFKSSSRGQTLTINGTEFRGSGNTLTINGTPFTAGKPAEKGDKGDPGPPGAAARIGGPAPLMAPDTTLALDGTTTAVLATLKLNSTTPGPRIQLLGGFNAVCNPCTRGTQVTYEVVRDGSVVVSRRLPTLDAEQAASGVLSEMIVGPDVCGPCTFELRARGTSAVGSAPGTLDLSGIRFAIVDLGRPQ